MIDNIVFDSEDNGLRVIYIDRVGKDIDGNNVFHFLCTYGVTEVWCEEWGDKPACNCRHLQPEGQFDRVFEVKTDIDFVLGQENCCCSYQDVCDGCVAMAYENIDAYEEYPDFRLVFGYGDKLEEIEEKLSKREVIGRFVE